jgi:hypothetical protein
MATNEFLPFGIAVNANVITQAQYNGLPERTVGFAPGIALSEELNKVWRQAAFVTAGLGQVVADKTDLDVLDDGDLPAFVHKLNIAMSGFPDVNMDNVLYARRDRDWVNLDNILHDYATRQFVSDLVTGMETQDMSYFLQHYVLRAGDSMTGPLTLPGPPTHENHASSKGYVDAEIGRIETNKVARGGDSMTGFLTLHAAPTTDMHAATRRYVLDTVAGAAPTGFLALGGGTMTGPIVLPATNATGNQAVRFNQLATYLPLGGGTLSGFLTLHANPTANMHAVPRQYVDGREVVIRGDFQNSQGELRRDVEDSQGELRRDVEDSQGELRRDVEDSQGEMRRDMDDFHPQVGGTAPLSPRDGKEWLNTNDGLIYLWHGGRWSPIGSAGGTPTHIIESVLLAYGTTIPPNPTEGMLWFNPDHDRLQIYTTQRGWRHIADTGNQQ